ncbi:glycosyltransferase [bacterium]|nr:glycosyltransferase [bacterium]
MTSVSVIIPVYNVEKYIRQALDSVVSQTFKDIEIICVNDCSGDNSFEIAKEYAKKDPRFVLFEQDTNKGQGVARNKGIELSKGEYIMFLDPDDFYEQNTVELAYKHIKKNKTDFVAFNFYDFDEETGEKTVNMSFLRLYKTLKKPETLIKPYKIVRPFIDGCLTVMNIYNAQFLKNNNIKYAEDIRMGEDTVFYFSVIAKAKSMSVLYKELYTYRHHKSSTSNTPEKRWQEHFIARDRAYDIISKSNHSKELMNSCIKYIISSNIYWFDKWFKDKTKKDNQFRENYYNKMKEMFCYIEKNHNINDIYKYFNYKKFKFICDNNYEEYIKLRLADSSVCTGCGACYNVCPVGAITMEKNQNGFLHPVINKEKCIDCRKCENACPVLTIPNENTPSPICYAAMADDEIRLLSSSGGIFPLIAEYVIDNGGYVAGAAFEGIKLKHIIINNKNELYKLKGSKYIQSDIGTIYKDIKQLLQQNKTVLFSGTPCQCAGLNSYLQRKYENLICIDVICHGVPNQKVFEKYISELIKPDEKYSTMSFRNKKLAPWSFNHVTTVMTDKSEYNLKIEEDFYLQAFLKNLSLRTSCEECNFRCIPMQGDITLGDFWKVDEYKPQLNDKKGTSAILINNKKGKLLFEAIKNKLKIFESVPLDSIVNGNPHLTSKVTIKNENKKLFFKLLKEHSVKDAVNTCITDKCDYLIHNFWWTTYNYGAILTCYALQELIKSYGLFPKIFNAKETVRNNRSRFLIDFQEKYLDVTQKYNVKEAKELSKNVKGIIIGSDQVLRLEYIDRYKNLYLLNFADLNCKKIALSASFGLDKQTFLKDKYSTKENVEIMKNALKSFDYVSTREISGKQIFKDIIGMDSDFILDPVFLIDKNKYEYIAKQSDIDTKDKIVTYVLDSNEEYKKLYEYLGNQYNAEIYNLNIDKNSVEDWLKAIKDCKLFIADSFHGVCFALIFNKPFICIQNKQRGNARFETLIELFDIKENFVLDINDVYKNNIKFIPDYNKINNKITIEKERCLNIIKKILKDDYSNNKEAVKNKELNEKYVISKQRTLKNRFKHAIKYASYKKYEIFSKLYNGEKKKHYLMKKDKCKAEEELVYYE